MGANLELFEVFYNNGQGRVRLTADGQARIEENEEAFDAVEQARIAALLFRAALPLMEEALGLPLAELQDKAGQMGSGSPEETLASAADIASGLTAACGKPVRFQNKLAEVEYVFSPEAVPLFTRLDRIELDRRLSEALAHERQNFSHQNFFVFTGPEYCKVTLYRKESRVAEFLDGIGPGGRVIALGDSQVDLGFLRLRPFHVQYHPYYLGDPEDVRRLPSIKCSEQQHTEGGYQIIKEALEHPLLAVVSDIDNCVAPLDRPMEERMVLLLRRVLGQGVRLCLITGGHIGNRYFERVIDPIRGQDIS